MASASVGRRRALAPPRTCGVCGEPAKGYHFGGIACNSCMSFFRRTVRREVHEEFICIHGSNNCKMTRLERKKCQACRFAKCLRIGMEPRWVLNEDQRREMLTKQKTHDGKNGSNDNSNGSMVQRMYNPEPQNLLDCLSDAEHEAAVFTVVLFRSIIKSLPHEIVEQDFRERFCDVPNLSTDITPCAGAYMRSMQFAFSLPALQQIKSTNDRIQLVKRNLKQMTSTRIGFGYNPKSMLWPTELALEASVPVLDFRRFKTTLSARLYDTYMDFIQKMHLLKLDEACTTLLVIIQLFSSSGIPLEDESTVEALQSHFISMLRKYIFWRYGSLDATIVFAKVLSLLTDLHEIRDYENDEANTWLNEHELIYLSDKLGEVNPYACYSVERRDNEFLSAKDDPYDLLFSKTPTVEMIRECMTEAALLAQQNNKNDELECNLFDFLEENLPLIQEIFNDDSNQSSLDEIYEFSESLPRAEFL